MPIAVIAFDFDPLLRIGDGAVRWETVAIAAAILMSLVVAVVGARSLSLRADDLLFVILGIVPGAVIGGRLGYVLLHPDFFAAEPGRIIDPGIGSLELAVGVVGGTLSGCLVAALLDGQVGRWLHAATLPTLLVLGIGKFAMLLGGRGQGQPWDGELAVAFLGAGPWGSLAPDVPAHPAQLYEAVATLVVLAILMAALAVPGLRRPDGRSFAIGLGLWAVARTIVAATWRDPLVAGPLRAEQLIDLAIVLGCVVWLVLLVGREARRSTADGGEARPVAPGSPAAPDDAIHHGSGERV